MKNWPLPRMLFLFVTLLLSACTTPGSSLSKPDLSKLQVGMSRAQVIGHLGKPHQVSQQGQVEYLIYNFDHPFDGRPAIVASYFVRLVNGAVESFGEKGDFDSTRGSAATSGVAQATDSPPCDLYTELRKLEELKKDGVLSEEEFQAQKKKVLERCG